MTERREKWEHLATWFPLICWYTCASFLLPGSNLRPSVIWIITIWMWESCDHVLPCSSSWRSDATGKNSLSTHAPQPCWRSETRSCWGSDEGGWWTERKSGPPPVFLSPRLFWHGFGLAGIYKKSWEKKICSCRGERAVWQVAVGDIYLIHLLWVDLWPCNDKI